MKILVATDKFKGSLSANKACNAVKEGILNFNKSADIKLLPLADGGEGSLEVLEQKLNFKRISVKVNNPLFEPVTTWYGLAKTTAYIEMAKASGLLLLSKKTRHAPSTTSLGTGELIIDALKKGARKIYLFVGGSATNDAGIGVAQALGFRFLNKKKEILSPIGKNLTEIEFIEGKSVSVLADIEFILVTDVKNPLFGKNGAAHVFAKQKGATKKEMNQLDAGLRNFNEIAKRKWGKDISKFEGSGAAGGLGAGAMLFLNAKKEAGIAAIMKILDFDSYIKESDFVISGEGKLDKQTLEGKVVKGVIDKCIEFNKPLGIVCGVSELNEKELKEYPIQAIEVIKSDKISSYQAMHNAYNFLVLRAENLIKTSGY